MERSCSVTVYRRRPHRESKETPPVARSRSVKPAPWAMAAILLLVCASIARADSVVLIVSARSPIRELESAELRKLFMGFRVVSPGGVPLLAARNRSDPRLDKIFFQNIVAVSELVYERQLLTQKMREGSPLPTEFVNSDKLLDAVAGDPQIISYAWGAAAAKRSDVRVLRILWHD